MTTSEEAKFDPLDALQSLSAVNRQFEEIAEKMLASSHEETLLCLPMIGRILESCASLVAVHVYRDEIKAEIAEDCSETSSRSAAVSSSSPPQANNILINELTSFIARAAPSGIFSRRKAKRRRAKMLRNCVHPELFPVWYNAGQLFTPSKVSSYTTPPPLPTIALKDVNSFALRNVPTPSPYSVKGCSPDPAFYRTTFANKSAPFGSIYGYKTNVGIVPVPDDPVYGHVWNHEEGGWVLNALPSKKEVFIKPWRISRQTPRKAKEGTRYSTDQQHFL